METLFKCFASTFDPNPNTRKAAELEIRKLEHQEGMLSSAFQLVGMDSADLAVRQAAAIYVKNRVRRMWDTKPVVAIEAATGTPSNAVPIAESDRNAVRGSVLQTLVTAPPQVKVHVASALGAIVAADFPAQWPDLMDRIGELLNSGGQAGVYGGVRALLEVVRAYRWKDSANLMEPVVAATFPRLLAIGREVMDSSSSSSPEAGSIMHVIIKTYKTSMVMNLTQHQQADESIMPWGALLLAVVQKEIDPAQLPQDEESREESSWWHAKKWAYFSLNKLFARFGNPSQLPTNLKNYKPFAERFIKTFTPEILKVYLRQTEANIAGQQWLSQKAIFFLFSFYTDCVKPKSTWVLLKPHVDVLVQRFVFPKMCYNEDDEELWELDPVDYVRTHLDPVEDFNTASTAAAGFLQAVVSKRTESSFMPQLEFVTSVLQAYPASRSSREKEGALNMTRALDETMLRHPKVGEMLESFFMNHVVPELASQDRYLRFRAVDLVRTFAGQMRWTESANLEKTFTGIMTCLQDAELPVRVQAAQAIGVLIDHDEVKAAMAPNAGRLMQELLKLADETDLDVLSMTTAKIVDSFSEELLPFAVEFCTHLRESYLRLVNEHLANCDIDPNHMESVDLGKGSEDKVFAAVASLQTMYQVLSAAEGKPEMLAKLEEIILPLVAFTLEKECIELYDDCLDLTDMLTFNQKRISKGMWGIFGLIYKSFKSSGVDYLSEMLPTLDNIVSYGKETMMQHAEYKNMILDIFHTAMTSEQLGTQDRIAACKLADIILLLLKNSIDEAVPGILKLVLPLAAAEGNKTPLGRWSMIVTLDAMCYNAALAIQVLESEGATAGFLAAVLKDLESFRKVHDRKVLAVAFCSIIALPVGSLPQQVQEGLPQLLAGVVEVLHGLPDAINKRKEELEAFQGLDDDEDDDEAEAEDEDGDESAKFGDEDVLDEDNEYLEMLAEEGKRLRERAEAHANGLDYEDDDDDGEDEEEDMGFESPMDPVPVFDLFRSLAPAIQALAGSLAPAAQAKLRAVSTMQDIEVPAPSVVAFMG